MVNNLKPMTWFPKTKTCSVSVVRMNNSGAQFYHSWMGASDGEEMGKLNCRTIFETER